MIIKCTSQLKADFQKIFNIVNDGYNQVSDIINSEFKESPELLKIFMNNYHL